jgi:hypothetical protein
LQKKRFSFANHSKSIKQYTMKKTSIQFGKTILVIGLPLSLLFGACASESSKSEKYAPSTADISMTESAAGNAARANETESNAMADSTASVTNVYKPMLTGKLNDTNHVFMRNADMRCSVKDVRKATFALESIVRKYDGYVTYTSLSGNKALYYSNRISKDSATETYRLNIYNDITLRVPNENLDSMLIEMNELIEFIDNRTIKAEDVKLQLLAMSLKAKRNTQHAKNLSNAVTNQGKKLPQTIDGLNDIDNAKASYDEQQISIMDLKDKVSYSTVKLYVYQPEVVEYKKVAFVAPVEPYTPSFSDKLASTGQTSLVILQYLVLFFVVIWPFLLIFMLVWLIIKWMIRSKITSKIFKI